MAIGYRQIIMHAISRDAQSFAQPCIYLQLDEGDMMDDAADDDEEMLSPEVRLVPEHAQLIEGIFKTLCDCAALNPDTDVEGALCVHTVIHSCSLHTCITSILASGPGCLQGCRVNSSSCITASRMCLFSMHHPSPHLLYQFHPPPACCRLAIRHAHGAIMAACSP